MTVAQVASRSEGMSFAYCSVQVLAMISAIKPCNVLRIYGYVRVVLFSNAERHWFLFSSRAYS